MGIEYIGLIGLIGLLGFFGKSGFNEKVDELKKEVTKNNEQVEERVNNVEKIAADANRKAQEFSTGNQHLATKIDTQNLAQRIDAVEKASGAEKLTAIESSLADLQKRADEVAQANANLQEGLKNFEDKHFDAAINKLGSGVQNLYDRFRTIADNCKTFDDNFKILGTSVQSLDEGAKSLDERLKNLEDLPKPSDDPAQAERFTALEDEHKDLVQKFGEFSNALQKHHMALVQWKNNFVAIQNSFNAIQARFDENKKALDALQGQLVAQEKSIGDFKEKFDAQGNLIDSFQQSIDEFGKTFEALKGKTYLTIENFDIKPTGRIFFANKPNEVFQNLNIASNLSGLTSFLESSTYEKKENFIRIVENYRQNLKKVSDKVRRKKFNEDALSEEVTEAFFNTLSKFFLATIPISIYRGARQETLEALDENLREEEFKFYSAFLTKVNEYLAACQVYTAPVLPKNIMTSEDIDRMSVTRKETPNSAEDNVIDEVERLPYYMDYLTESGEIENFCSEGKMVVLKFDGGEQ